MNPAGDVWLCLLLVALFGALFFLRVRFQSASRNAETAVLVSAAILFFSICSFFLSPHRTSAQIAPQPTGRRGCAQAVSFSLASRLLHDFSMTSSGRAL